MTCSAVFEMADYDIKITYLEQMYSVLITKFHIAVDWLEDYDLFSF